MSASSHADPGPEPRPVAALAGNPAAELAAILRRRKGTIFFVFVVVTAVVAIGAFNIPPAYTAESSLMVRIGREYIYRSEVGRGTEAARMPSLSEMVNSEVEILSSHDLAEQVVKELGVELLYPDLLELEPDPDRALDKAVMRFRGGVAIRGVLESSVIRVGFEHTDPQIAADAVNLLVERFRDKHVEVFGEVRTTFLDEKLKGRQEDLARIETELSLFKQENEVYDLAEQRRTLLGRQAELDGELRDVEIEIAALKAVHGDLDREDEAVVAPDRIPDQKNELMTLLRELEGELREIVYSAPDALLEEFERMLLQLELERMDLERQFQEDNRQLQTLREKITEVQKYLTETEDRHRGVDEDRREGLLKQIAQTQKDIEALDRMQSRQVLRALEIRRDGFKNELAAITARISLLDRQETKLRQLERAREQSEALVQNYVERVEDARIAEDLDREKRINVRVIEKAARPLEPTGLSRNMKIALGGFAGLLSGAAVAVFLELFRVR